MSSMEPQWPNWHHQATNPGLTKKSSHGLRDGGNWIWAFEGNKTSMKKNIKARNERNQALRWSLPSRQTLCLFAPRRRNLFVLSFTKVKEVKVDTDLPGPNTFLIWRTFFTFLFRSILFAYSVKLTETLNRHFTKINLYINCMFVVVRWHDFECL